LKPDSLFNEGMQPVVFSTMANNAHKKGWQRAGFDISYYKNNIARVDLWGKEKGLILSSIGRI